MATDTRVPALGESVTEATIGQWFKKVGDQVAADEPLVELETDKVTIEVPAPAAGTLEAIAAKDGETVGIGALLGTLANGAAAKACPRQPRAEQARARQSGDSSPGGDFAAAGHGRACQGGVGRPE